MKYYLYVLVLVLLFNASCMKPKVEHNKKVDVVVAYQGEEYVVDEAFSREGWGKTRQENASKLEDWLIQKFGNDYLAEIGIVEAGSEALQQGVLDQMVESLGGDKGDGFSVAYAKQLERIKAYLEFNQKYVAADEEEKIRIEKAFEELYGKEGLKDASRYLDNPYALQLLYEQASINDHSEERFLESQYALYARIVFQKYLKRYAEENNNDYPVLLMEFLKQFRVSAPELFFADYKPLMNAN